MVIFHSFVSLPERKWIDTSVYKVDRPEKISHLVLAGVIEWIDSNGKSSLETAEN